MTDKKPTDKDIIRALECCNVETDCKRCPLYKEHSANCIDIACKNALDLITRQQAEIERLKAYNENLQTANTALSNDILDIKAEAVKEFAERVKERIYTAHFGRGKNEFFVTTINPDDLDNLVKERVGENILDE